MTSRKNESKPSEDDAMLKRVSLYNDQILPVLRTLSRFFTTREVSEYANAIVEVVTRQKEMLRMTADSSELAQKYPKLLTYPEEEYHSELLMGLILGGPDGMELLNCADVFMGAATDVDPEKMAKVADIVIRLQLLNAIMQHSFISGFRCGHLQAGGSDTYAPLFRTQGWGEPQESGWSTSSLDSPFSIDCHQHGRIWLSLEELARQSQLEELGWTCPLCGEPSPLHDDS